MKTNQDTGRKERIVLLKKKMVDKPDGTSELKFEYVTDAKEINKELKKRNSEGDSGGRGGPKSGGSARKPKPGGPRRNRPGGKNNSGIVQDGSKMKISINRMEAARHKAIHGNDSKKRKRDAILEAEHEYVAPTASSRNSRLKRNPEHVLNSYLKKIVEEMYRSWEGGNYFIRPVDTKQFVDYADKIAAAGSHAVDLGHMRDKVTKGDASIQYRHSSELRDDMDTLVRNSEIYNGPEHPVTLAAKKVRTIGLRAWEAAKGDIEKVDAAIEEAQQ